MDHGDLGAEFLREHDRIRIFAETDHDTILHAVEYHNKYRLPDTLSDRDRRFADITRDADKLERAVGRDRFGGKAVDGEGR